MPEAGRCRGSGRPAVCAIGGATLRRSRGKRSRSRASGSARRHPAGRERSVVVDSRSRRERGLGRLLHAGVRRHRGRGPAGSYRQARGRGFRGETQEGSS
ncbi:hypothetical protein ACU16_12625 [Xanthomonas oryzae pv. oryzicola]|nr:hypothetical protein ACU16_12625 [Xanthomonas oryzae pv. oryzicola]